MRESSNLVRPASADDLPAARAVAEPRLERLGFHAVRDEPAQGLVSDQFPELHEVLIERLTGER